MGNMNQQEFYKNLPAKRMGAGALIFNADGQLLLVKPHYKDHWSIPGGIVDKEESPRQACLREVEEEIGIKLESVKFLCIDWISTKGDKNENLQFIFYGDRLTEDQTEKIELDDKEIAEYRFVGTEKAVELLDGPTRNLAKRLPKCLEAMESGKSVYLEDGMLP